MIPSQNLTRDIQSLPRELQEEVLDFVAFLKQKSEKSHVQKDECGWSDFSLASAMRGLEDNVDYSEGDLKEKWQ